MSLTLDNVTFRPHENDNVRRPKFALLVATLQEQALITGDPTIQAFAALTGAADKVPYFDGDDDMALADLTAAGRAMIAALTASAQRTLLRNGCMVRKQNDEATADYVTGPGRVVTWDQEIYDDNGWHDNSTNPSFITVPSGVDRAMFGCNIRINNITPAAGEKARVQILKNGAVAYDGQAVRDWAHNVGNAFYVGADTGPVPVVAGDDFEVHLTITLDASVTITAAQSNFWAKAC